MIPALRASPSFVSRDLQPAAPSPALEITVPRDTVGRPVPAPSCSASAAPVAPPASFPKPDESVESALLADLSSPHREVVRNAIAALPPVVAAALTAAGYRIRVVESEGPAPFGFVPYPVDALRGADPTCAVAEGRKLVLNGAQIAVERSDPYFTFDDLARQRGATSPEEIAEMSKAAAGLNPGLAEANGDIPPGRRILIPDYYYWRGQRVPTAAWLAITQEAQGIAGTTFDHRIPATDAPQKLILMSGSAFRDPLIEFYLHHEIGHAVADILATTDPAFARDLHEAMASRMEADRAAGTLLRPYAGSEPDEFLADAFAARFLSAPPVVVTEADRQRASLSGETLLAKDPAAWRLAQQMIAHLGHGV